METDIDSNPCQLPVYPKKGPRHRLNPVSRSVLQKRASWWVRVWALQTGDVHIPGIYYLPPPTLSSIDGYVVKSRSSQRDFYVHLAARNLNP